MANTKSAIKAARKSLRFQKRNQAVKSRIKTLRKNYERALKDGNAETVRSAASALVSAMDRATKSGVVHRNAASRVKASVSKHVFGKK